MAEERREEQEKGRATQAENNSPRVWGEEERGGLNYQGAGVSGWWWMGQDLEFVYLLVAGVCSYLNVIIPTLVHTQSV